MRGPLALPGLAEKGLLLGADYSSPLTARQDSTDCNSTARPPPVAEKNTPGACSTSDQLGDHLASPDGARTLASVTL